MRHPPEPPVSKQPKVAHELQQGDGKDIQLPPARQKCQDVLPMSWDASCNAVAAMDYKPEFGSDDWYDWCVKDKLHKGFWTQNLSRLIQHRPS